MQDTDAPDVAPPGPRNRAYEWVPLLVWLVVAVLAAVLLANEQQRDRGEREEFVVLEAQGRSDVLTNTIDRLHAGLGASAVELLAGEDVDVGALRTVVVGLGLDAGAVFDDQGRYLVSTTFRGEVVGEDFTTRLEHLQVAESQGRPAVSQVVVSPELDTAAVGLAVPYPTPTGRRIVTGVLALREGALADLLELEGGGDGSTVDLVDRDGNVIASTRGGVPAEVVPYAEWNGAAAAAVEDDDAGIYTAAGGEERVFASVPVNGTGWTLVTWEDAATLFARLAERARSMWTAYGIFVVLGLLMSAAAARELSRRHRAEETLRELSQDLGRLVDDRTAELRSALEQARTGERSARRYAAVAESAAEAIIGHDLDGTITSWNLAAERLYGYVKKDAVGSPISRLAAPGREQDLLPTVPARGPAPPVLTRTVDHDGNEHEVKVSTAPILDEEGGPVGAVSIHLDVTDHHRATVDRSHATALFESLFRSGPPQALVAPDGTVLEANVQLCEMLGYSRDELLTMSVITVTDPIDREITRNYLQELQDGARSSVQVRKRYRHRDGHELIGLLHLTRVEGIGDHDDVLVGVVQDVTDLVTAQQQLAERGALLAGVTSSSANILTMYDATGTCVFASGAGLARIGETPESMVGTTFLSRHADDPGMLDALGRALDGEAVDVTTRFRGGVYDVRLRAVGDDRPPAYVALATTDITERQRAQDALQRSERRFRALVQHANDAILELDPAGRILRASDAIADMSGLPPEEIEGRSLFEFITPAAERQVRADLARLNEGVEVTGHLRLRTDDGRVRHLAYDGVDLRDDPAIGTLVVTLHDETLHVRAQEERVAQAQALEAVNEQLVKALRVRDNILSATTHELRTPLTPMVGLLELLDARFDEVDRDELRGYLDVLRRNTDRLTGLVEDLLFATHVRTGTVTAVPEEVQVRPAVERAIGHYLETARATVTGPDVTAWCQAEHLDQVLNALLGNAARYGRAPYRVAVARVGDTVQITVADGGDGVPKEKLSMLFEPFMQGSTGDRRTATRLGLGLPIARALLQANGGDLAYEPAATGGAAFRVTLPLATPHRLRDVVATDAAS